MQQSTLPITPFGIKRTALALIPKEFSAFIGGSGVLGLVRVKTAPLELSRVDPSENK